MALSLSYGIALPKSDRPLARFVRRLCSHPASVVGLVVVVIITLLAIFGPSIAPYDPFAQSWLSIRKPPSGQFWLGTDELGRDLLSRLIVSSRASLLAGLIALSVALSIGVPLGLLAGYVGGWLDSVISSFTDAMLTCPSLILAITLAALLGPSLQNAMIAFGITAIPIFIRLVRGEVVAISSMEFVQAARAVGNPEWRIAVRHILPNVIPALLVQATLTIAMAILAEASLSYLGLGQQPPAPSWGSMLSSAQPYLIEAPWMALWPGLAIFFTVLAFNLLGDGIRDALDPKS